MLYYSLERENNLRSFERSELERNFYYAFFKPLSDFLLIAGTDNLDKAIDPSFFDFLSLIM